MKNRKEVVIIGGGLGGIATAIFLSQRNFNVTIIEKNENIVIFDYLTMSPFAQKGENAKLIKQMLLNLKAGLTYLALHPNTPGEIEMIDPEQWHIRTEEHALFKDKEFLEWIKTIENLHCISMREIKSLIF